MSCTGKMGTSGNVGKIYRRSGDAEEGRSDNRNARTAFVSDWLKECRKMLIFLAINLQKLVYNYHWQR